jgi:HTH-type transcriptional regulator/antitoxin HipB
MSTLLATESATMVLAENLKLLRSKHGLTQHELADAIGVSHPRISDIERQSGNPTLKTITKIAEFFGVTESCLLDPKKIKKKLKN